MVRFPSTATEPSPPQRVRVCDILHNRLHTGVLLCVQVLPTRGLRLLKQLLLLQYEKLRLLVPGGPAEGFRGGVGWGRTTWAMHCTSSLSGHVGPPDPVYTSPNCGNIVPNWGRREGVGWGGCSDLNRSNSTWPTPGVIIRISRVKFRGLPTANSAETNPGQAIIRGRGTIFTKPHTGRSVGGLQCAG